MRINREQGKEPHRLGAALPGAEVPCGRTVRAPKRPIGDAQPNSVDPGYEELLPEAPHPQGWDRMETR